MKLYQFAGSHFCEKARWALDYKSVDYRAVNLVPGLHVKVVRKLAGKRGLPILLDGDTVIQDSSAIISYLDDKFPAPGLTPADAPGAREALQWERYLDEHIGVNLRLWFYYHALPNTPIARRFLSQGTSWFQAALFRMMFPTVREKMRQLLKINADSARRAEEQLLAALARLDAALDGRRFLVGDQFSRADLTACAMLSPCLRIAEEDVATRLPPALIEWRAHLKSRPFYHWVQGIYDTYRQPGARTCPAMVSQLQPKH